MSADLPTASSSRPALGSSLKRRLNIGCGHYPMADCLNVDFDPAAPADLHLDLDQGPLPFADSSFDEIRAFHVLEHLKDPFATMRELHRLLSREGRLHIKVPHFSRGFTHPDHKHGFDVSFPLFFNPSYPPWYIGCPLHLERMRLRWNAQPYLKRYFLPRPALAFLALSSAIIDGVANLSPMTFSRLLSFWVGGFEEIEFVFTRPPSPMSDPNSTTSPPLDSQRTPQ